MTIRNTDGHSFTDEREQYRAAFLALDLAAQRYHENPSRENLADWQWAHEWYTRVVSPRSENAVSKSAHPTA